MKKKYLLLIILLAVTSVTVSLAQGKLDYRSPVYVNGNGGNGDNIEWSFIVSSYKPGTQGGISFTADSIYGYHIYIKHTPIVTFLRFIHGIRQNEHVKGQFPWSRVQLITRDSSRFITYINKKPVNQNFHTLQLYSLMPVSMDKLEKMAVKNAEIFFDLKVKWEMQKRKCLVFKAKDTSLIYFKEGERILHMDSHNYKFWKINNAFLSEVFEGLNVFTDFHYSPYPFVDETGLRGKLGNINLDFGDKTFKDISVLNNALKKYGMSVSVEERSVNVMVVIDLKTVTEEEARSKKFRNYKYWVPYTNPFSVSIPGYKHIKTFAEELDEILTKDDTVALANKFSKIPFDTCMGDYSLLAQVIRNKASHCLEYLLNQQVDVNRICNDYKSPLMFAIKYMGLGEVKKLVQRGASIKYKFGKQTALDLAKLDQKNDIVYYLEQLEKQ